MFSGIKPMGVSPLCGVSSHNAPTPTTDRSRFSLQNYDQLLVSPQPAGEEGRIRETVTQISQQIRIRPTRNEISALQQQVRDGTYQYNPREIAARMLLETPQEG